MRQPIPISTGRGVRPAISWLTVNRACNMRCGWCYAKGTEYRKEDDMTFDFATNLVDMMLPLGVRTVTLIGGEPTLWEPLFEFNEHCRRVGMQTLLVTNGTRFGQDSFWARYQQSPCNRIGLSVKAFNETSFECTTGVSGWALTKRGIERALSTGNCGANVVYTGENPQEIVDLARFCREAGAKQFGISPSTPAFVNGKPDLLHSADPKRFIDSIVQNYDELHEIFAGRVSIAVKIPLCLWPRSFVERVVERGQLATTCQLQHRTGLLFDTDGSVISCNSLHDFPIGKLGDQFSDSASLREHLQSKEVVDFYDHVSSYASTKCVTCSMRRNCGGGCPLIYGAMSGEKLIPGWDQPSEQESITENAI